MKFKYLFLLFLFCNLIKSCDLVIFCHSSPLQLEVFLDSVKKNILGLNETLVLHDHHFQDCYFDVKKKFFLDATFINVYTPAQIAIKETIERCVVDYEAKYILFAHAKMFVKEKIDLTAIINLLESQNINVCVFSPEKILEKEQFGMILINKRYFRNFIKEVENIEFKEQAYWPKFSFISKNSFFINNKVVHLNYLPRTSELVSKFKQGFRLILNDSCNIDIDIKDLKKVV